MNHEMIQKDFEKTYNDLSEPIFRQCYFRIRDRERALELTQDVFIRAWDYIRAGKEVKNMRAFIYKIAMNLIINEVQRRKTHMSLDEMNEGDGFDPADESDLGSTASVAEKLEEELDNKVVFERLKEINPSYRDVLFMRYVDGLSVKDIAHILNEKENNISVRIHRGLEKLRELYTAYERS